MYGEPMEETCSPSVSDRIRWRMDDLRYKYRSALRKVGMWLVVKSADDSNSMSHARTELEILQKNAEAEDPDDPAQGWVTNDLLEMVAVFSGQGHSGFSASYCRQVLNKLLKFEPLTPLTGADDEWSDALSLDGNTLQNVRCGRIFKENGRAYDMDGIVFEDPDGARFTSRHSRVYIEFPYTPTTRIVKTDSDEYKSMTESSQ